MIIVTKSGEKLVVVLLGETIDAINEDMFRVTYENNHGNLRKTSQALGIHYKTARNWKKRLYGSTPEETERLQSESSR